MGRFTVKLIKLKLQGLSLAWVPSKALGAALNKYSLSHLILYSKFCILFHKVGPINCISSSSYIYIYIYTLYVYIYIYMYVDAGG
jgi:hypothetical protein